MRLVRRNREAWMRLRQKPLATETVETVSRIIQDVRERGDGAVRDWTARLDSVHLDTYRVSPDALTRAERALDPDLRSALEVALKRVQSFYQNEAGRMARVTAPDAVGGISSRVIREPLNRVAVYIPAGRWPLPSSLLMTAVPAQAAGVQNIAVVTPPRGDGQADATTLAAARLLGLDEVYLVGGAQAVAACAYGTETLPRADKVVGPGNRWVTEAKRQLQGTIGIDGLNGPSEVVIWAEPPAAPLQVAMDLLAQAEHGADSWALVVSTSPEFLTRIEQALAELDGAERLLEQEGVGALLAHDADQAVQFVNEMAPEHLELWGAAETFAARLNTAGATFINCPTPLGDYAAGPSHVLPTGGSARFASVLGVEDFVRRRTETRITGNAAPVVGAAALLAGVEGLVRHRQALERFMA